VTPDNTLITALTGIVPAKDIAPNIYYGTAEEYIVFNYNEYPELFGDDTNELLRYFVQVHYVCPHRKNPTEKKRRIRAALTALDGNVPTCVNASDDAAQHYVYEFSLVGDPNG